MTDPFTETTPLADPPPRCGWCGENPLYVRYHDHEWGVPLRDDHRLFELLLLEGAQAGLAWITILRKRDGYRRAFVGFDAAAVARFSRRDIERLARDPGIVRHRGKIEAAVVNARAFLRVQVEFGRFADYIWGFTEGRTIQNRWRTITELPVQTPQSRRMSHDLRRRGFKFVGPTICYAFMQAAGLVNDHVVGCYRHAELARYGDPSAAP
jgi:DNA-3-methyladenine glycosylase I